MEGVILIYQPLDLPQIFWDVLLLISDSIHFVFILLRVGLIYNQRSWTIIQIYDFLIFSQIFFDTFFFSVSYDISCEQKRLQFIFFTSLRFPLFNYSILLKIL